MLVLSKIYGTNYYVSSSEGDNSNDGLSPETALKTVHHVNYLLDKVVNLQPGDSVLFKRGDYFYGNLLHLFKVKGTQEQPIVFSAYGEGENPYIVANSKKFVWSKLEGTNYNDVYYTDDFGYKSELLKAAHNKKALSIKPLNGHNISDANGLIEYVNDVLTEPNTCGPFGYTSRIVVRTVDGNPPSFPEYLFFSGCVSLRFCENVVFENFNLRSGVDGIFIEYGSDITLQNCNTQENLGLGVKIISKNIKVLNNFISKTGNNALYCLYSDNILIRGNEMSEVAYSPFGIPSGGDQCMTGYEFCKRITLEYNYIHHGDKGHFYDPNEDYGDTVRNNYVYNVRGFGAYHGAGINVYNNIFNSGEIKDVGFGGVWLTGPDDIKIYNNVFYLKDHRAHTTALESHIAGPREDSVYPMDQRTGTVSFLNNVVHAESDKSIWLTSYNMEKTVADNNCFSTGGKVQMQAFDVNYHTLKDFITGTGLETNSYFGEPEFIASQIDPELIETYKFAPSYPCKEAGIEDMEIMREYFPHLFANVSTGIVSFQENSLKVYPNPSTGLFNIELDPNMRESVSVNVTDLAGKVVYSSSFTGRLTVDLQSLTNGVYFLNVYNGSNYYNFRKIVKY